MTPEVAALLEECGRFIKLAHFSYASLSSTARGEHMAKWARELAGRCEGAVRANGDG